jgi:hypothetical protein
MTEEVQQISLMAGAYDRPCHSFLKIRENFTTYLRLRSPMAGVPFPQPYPTTFLEPIE